MNITKQSRYQEKNQINNSYYISLKYNKRNKF